MSDFKGRHFRGEIVLWTVRWSCRYAVSYRDLEAMMTERGIAVDHSTNYRWVQRFAPEVEKRLRLQWRRPRSGTDAAESQAGPCRAAVGRSAACTESGRLRSLSGGRWLGVAARALHCRERSTLPPAHSGDAGELEGVHRAQGQAPVRARPRRPVPPPRRGVARAPRGWRGPGRPASRSWRSRGMVDGGAPPRKRATAHGASSTTSGAIVRTQRPCAGAGIS